MDDEADRNLLLDMLLNEMVDDDGKTSIGVECLDAILRMLDLQETPEGKVRLQMFCIHFAKLRSTNLCRIHWQFKYGSLTFELRLRICSNTIYNATKFSWLESTNRDLLEFQNIIYTQLCTCT